MSRLTRVSILAVAALAIAAGAYANHPDPPLSDVPDAITLSPGTQYVGNPIGTFVVHVEGQAGAVSGAFVEVEISEYADVLIGWCEGQGHPIQTAFSDANGDARFEFFGGGCIDPGSHAAFHPAFIAQVRADGIVLAEPSFITSPDAVNSQGRTATDTAANNCENGETKVGLADAVFHTRSIKLSLVEKCTKYTPPFSDPVGLDDAVFVTPYIKNSNFCVCQ